MDSILSYKGIESNVILKGTDKNKYYWTVDPYKDNIFVTKESNKPFEYFYDAMQAIYNHRDVFHCKNGYEEILKKEEIEYLIIKHYARYYARGDNSKKAVEKVLQEIQFEIEYFYDNKFTLEEFLMYRYQNNYLEHAYLDSW